MLLISKDYQHNNNHINCIKFINIEHIQLKLLIFQNDLILMSISEVLFIAEAIISTTYKSINNTVDHFQSINDIKIKL